MKVFIVGKIDAVGEDSVLGYVVIGRVAFGLVEG